LDIQANEIGGEGQGTRREQFLIRYGGDWLGESKEKPHLHWNRDCEAGTARN